MKTIELPKGKFAIVDDWDYDELMQWDWYYVKPGYALRSFRRNKRGSSISMHGTLLSPPTGMEIDHINGDRLDNRRSNLRVCTRAENACNRKLNTNNKSGYRGVSWYKAKKRWRADIAIKNKSITLGLFKTKEEAAEAYKQAALKYHGKFARII